MSTRKVRLPIVRAHAPGRGWRIARRASQAVLLGATILAPLLGGWQRLARRELSSWSAPAWDLPGWLSERLPAGEAAARAHEVNRLVGGGAALDLVGVSVVDPIFAAVALGAGVVSATLLVALLVPVVVGGLAGRMFCGWACPFGTLSRIIRSIVRRLPVRPPALRIPARRPVRWALLVVCVGLGLVGVEAPLLLTLPHVLLQQSIYAAWLMGGAGAAAGWLLGLLVAGVALGPTLACATLCPTGATLGLLGRRRIVQVTLASPPACGAHCALCSHACWLGLDPASGDPGPDCDSCARCFEVCPKTNLRVGVRYGDHHGVAAAAFVSVALLLAGCGSPEGRFTERPALTFETRRVVGDVTLSVSVVDMQGVRLEVDDPAAQRGTVLSVGIRRSGRRSENPSLEIETYPGPLTVDLYRADGHPLGRLSMATPNSPRSTPRQRIFRAHLAEALQPQDRLVVDAPAWLGAPVSLVLPDVTAVGEQRVGTAFLAGLLLFVGLGSLALAIPGRG